MKSCFYCNENIDTETDDYEKMGRKYICVFCYEEYADEIDNIDAEEDGIQSEDEE